MAYIDCKLKSQLLQRTVAVKLYLPTDLPAEVGNTVKGVLTLLHGYTNCGEDWLQMTSAARYAADNGLVLIIPDCDNSFYQNMVYGGAYYSFMTEELPLLLRTIFRLSPPRSQNYIAGLSMGGYGALYLGLSRPDIWAGCASFSGAVDLALMLRDPSVPGVRETFAPIFGDGLALPPASNLHYLAGQAAQLSPARQPKILLTNGFQDEEPYFIAMQNDSLHETLRRLPLANYKRLQWNGVHEWNFWDRSLVYAIDYFFAPGYAAKKLGDWRSGAVEAGCGA